jgi:hypothetical protein
MFSHGLTNIFEAMSGACATIASDALMNPFDGTTIPVIIIWHN